MKHFSQVCVTRMLTLTLILFSLMMEAQIQPLAGIPSYAAGVLKTKGTTVELVASNEIGANTTAEKYNTTQAAVLTQFGQTEIADAFIQNNWIMGDGVSITVPAFVSQTDIVALAVHGNRVIICTSSMLYQYYHDPGGTSGIGGWNSAPAQFTNLRQVVVKDYSPTEFQFGFLFQNTINPTQDVIQITTSVGNQSYYRLLSGTGVDKIHLIDAVVDRDYQNLSVSFDGIFEATILQDLRRTSIVGNFFDKVYIDWRQSGLYDLAIYQDIRNLDSSTGSYGSIGDVQMRMTPNGSGTFILGKEDDFSTLGQQPSARIFQIEGRDSDPSGQRLYLGYTGTTCANCQPDIGNLEKYSGYLARNGEYITSNGNAIDIRDGQTMVSGNALIAANSGPMDLIPGKGVITVKEVPLGQSTVQKIMIYKLVPGFLNGPTLSNIPLDTCATTTLQLSLNDGPRVTGISARPDGQGGYVIMVGFANAQIAAQGYTWTGSFSNQIVFNQTLTDALNQNDWLRPGHDLKFQGDPVIDNGEIHWMVAGVATNYCASTSVPSFVRGGLLKSDGSSFALVDVFASATTASTAFESLSFSDIQIDPITDNIDTFAMFFSSGVDMFDHNGTVVNAEFGWFNNQGMMQIGGHNGSNLALNAQLLPGGSFAIPELEVSVTQLNDSVTITALSQPFSHDPTWGLGDIPLTQPLVVHVDTFMQKGNYALYASGRHSSGNIIPGATQQPKFLTKIVTVTTDDIVVLPVELLSFAGAVRERDNLLTWTTVSEENTSKFVVERSVDGIDFERIGEVSAAGNSAVELHYQFIDHNPFPKAYYRLKMVDLDDSFEFSNIIYLERGETVGLTLFPNPASDRVTVTVAMAEHGDVKVHIFDQLGRLVEYKEIKATSGLNQVELDIKNLPAGVYEVQVTGENSSSVKTLMKK